jgi:uncharacterized membrane protein
MKMLLILTSVFLGVFGQILFKKTMSGVGSLSVIEAFFIYIKSGYFYLGTIFYGLSLVLWMKILSDTDLSYARPFAATGYILTALFAMMLLGETIPLMRWVGIFLIAAGVVLVAQT